MGKPRECEAIPPEAIRRYCQIRIFLGQHRTMGTAGFGGSFAPIVQYEKWEIHPVFPHFSYFRLCQNLSPNLLAPLCGAALKNIGVPRFSPAARRFHFMYIGFPLETDKLEFGGPSERVIPNQSAFLVWESPSNSVLSIVIQTILFVPFSGIHPREMVLLSGRLPHQ